MGFKAGNDNWSATHAPWNKGLKGIHLSPKSEFKKGNPAWLKGDKGLKPWHNISGLRPPEKGERNSNWKGDAVGYKGLHIWIIRTYGKAIWCCRCGSVVNVQWANISHEYKRDIHDWMELCKSCHMRYDRKNGWGKGKQRYGENYGDLQYT